MTADGKVTVPARNFREPFRSQFVHALWQGAASADIHDIPERVGYSVSAGQPSAAFLRDELERPYSHSENICRWIRHLNPVGRILDVGCGTAALSVALAWTFPDAAIDSLDADELSIRAARLRVAGYGLAERIRSQVLPPNSTFPYPAESFDLVGCTSVLEFITRAEDRRRLLSEIRRVLRPGGHIVITTPNPWYPFELHSRRFLGNWRRRRGFPWASTRGWIRHQLPDFIFHQLPARVASKFRLELPSLLSRIVAPCLPWQFLLAQAPGAKTLRREEIPGRDAGVSGDYDFS